MNARILTTAPVDDTVLNGAHVVEDVGDDVGAALLHIVAHHRLRGVVTGAYLGNGPCYCWRSGDGLGLVRLGDDGGWHSVDDLSVPDLGIDPVEATRGWCADHDDFEAIEGYVLEAGVVRASCWAWSPDHQNLIDAAARRWGVPDGVAYLGIPVRLPVGDSKRADDGLDRPLSELNLPKRVVNYLFRHSGIATVRELLMLSRAELHRLPGIGYISAREVDEALADHGLYLPWASQRPSQPGLAAQSARAEPLEILALSPKSMAKLRAGGVSTVGDLLDRTLAALLRLDGVGDRMATEVRDALGRRGLKLKVYERGHPRPIPGDPSVPVEELWIAPYIGHRKTRTLRAAGIATVGDLTRVTAEELLALPKFGTVAVRSIRAWMEGLGFKLKGE